MAPDHPPDPIEVALAVASILEQLGIPYLVGGSIASPLHGELRSTNDLDFVADVRPAHVARLLAALGQEFYVAEEAMREALQFGTSFNAERLAHRQRVQVRTDPPGEMFVDTPEHSVLRKLERYDQVNVTGQSRLAVDHRRHGARNHVGDTKPIQGSDKERDEICVSHCELRPKILRVSASTSSGDQSGWRARTPADVRDHACRHRACMLATFSDADMPRSRVNSSSSTDGILE